MVTENINIKVDDRGSAKVVRRDVASIGVAADKSDNSVGILNKALIALGGAAVLTGAVKTLANFSQEMSTVQAITKATDDQFKNLRETAKQLGSETRFSATQAAEAMSFLARAGFNTDQILASVDDTLQLAQAGALDLGSAADIASNVLTGFRINAEDAGRVVDVLASAANSANTNVMQLGDAAKFVAPVAAGMNVSLEESVAALGALSDAGLQASMAGTGLRKILSTLEKAGPPAQKVFDKLGISADQVRISEVGLTQAMKVLAEAGIDTAGALELFGDRGGPAFSVLVNAIPKVEKLTEKFKNAEGTAAEMARIMDDNLNGALLSVKSAVEALIIGFGDLGAESSLTNFFRGLADAIRFVASNAGAAAQAMGFLIATMAVPKIIAFVKAMEGATLAQKAFNFAVASNPLGLLLTAVTTVVAALILFQDEITFTEDGVASLGNVMTATWEFAADAIKTFGMIFSDVWAAISGDAQASLTEVNLSLETFVRLGAKAVDANIGFWTGLWRTIVAIWENFPDIIYNAMISAINGVIKVTESGINAAVDLLNSFRSAVGLEEYAQVELGNVMNLADRSFEEIGKIAGEAFQSGWNVDYAQNALDGIFARARELSLEDIVSSASGKVSDSTKGPGAGGTGSEGEDAGSIVPKADEFQEYLAMLEKEKELMMLSTEERKIATEVIALEKDLKRELTNEEQMLIEASLEELGILERQSQLLQEIRGPQDEYLANVQALNELLSKGTITQDEFNKKLEELDLEKLGKEMGDFGKVFEDAFSDAASALTDFVKTGEADFNGLVTSILEDLAELAFAMAQQELFSAAGAGGGAGGGGGIGSALSSVGGGAAGAGFAVGTLIGNMIKGYADGGRPRVNEVAMVGERGPELFVPDTAGTVVPSNEINVQGHSMVNNNQINLTPEIIDSLLNSPAGSKAFVKATERNAKAMSQVIGSS